MEGEEIVLTKPEWSEIIDCFSANMDKSETGNSIYGGVQVDYMLFCESVLDPHDLDIKIRDYRTGDISRKIDKSKEYLSKSIKKPFRKIRRQQTFKSTRSDKACLARHCINK
jgi:hypothetical protein